MASLRLLIILAAAVCAASAARADGPTDLAHVLKGNTLVFTDAKTGLENSIYFGRFGHDFDRYVPCVSTVGEWRVAEDGGLCLEETEGGPLKACFKVAKTAGGLSLAPAGETVAYAARLLDGNQLPFG